MMAEAASGALLVLQILSYVFVFAIGAGVLALCAGADYVVSARGFMFALGCIQALQCNKNTCPTGITTHNPKLQYGLDPTNKAARVANYAKNMCKEVGIIAHACGVPEPRRLRRMHCRIVQSDSRSVPMDVLYPEPERVAAAAE